ncbi:YeeE/YedE family protein [Chitinophaga sancti]|uniref:YeeE/YedE thiosulfate transporter family protein n=1 Tax=Chitinophaga sancti TaxID=1004 RepID=A0A1K1RYG8_9BACT|nr:YeeE/YedE thiosulfate transporter family protein [Chitinophaga sancti]WQD64070.1 YeeE/YedE thiosulfate transporter family protein [Chitinophaga sancti]WQG90306.1 YeeE/YedE thiosulfate transporter family protein [Chitinophaga sancti]SFW76852.1 hypothetical protein SAMN05661012_04425 [Chitinophaga sancti]
MLLKLISAPWPWYVAGPIIGLTVPLLLLLGNRPFGISSSLRHICAACFPGKVPFFAYEWKKEIWNLFFAAGIVIGGFIAAHLLADPAPVRISPKLETALGEFGISDHNNLLPSQLFNWPALLTIRGFILIVVGGFLVGFGTRYAGGCTSGHSIFGLSTLQWPSLVATCCFMAGGFIMSNLVLPFILSLS